MTDTTTTDTTPTGPAGDSASTDVALVAATANGVALMEDDDIDFADDAGAGFENVTDSMKIIPFLRVLQDLSPQTKKTKKEYIEGALPGHFWETASNTFYKGEDGVILVPIAIQQKWIEWVPRDAGGGMVRRWEDESYKRLPGYVKDEKGSKYRTPEGNEIIEYVDVYAMLVDADGVYRPLVFSAKSTAIQGVRGMITMCDQVRVLNKATQKRFRPAMYYSAFRVKLKEQSNESGTWYGVLFSRENDTVNLPGGKDVYLAAKEISLAIQEGTVGVRDEDSEDHGGEAGPTPQSGPTGGVDHIDAI